MQMHMTRPFVRSSVLAGVWPPAPLLAHCTACCRSINAGHRRPLTGEITYVIRTRYTCTQERPARHSTGPSNTHANDRPIAGLPHARTDVRNAVHACIHHRRGAGFRQCLLLLFFSCISFSCYLDLSYTPSLPEKVSF
jgi:hypothetical protein